MAGLDSPARHLARIAARFAKDGHDIPEAKVRERYRSSMLNLITLLPLTHRLELFDNSTDTGGSGPVPKLVLRADSGRIDYPATRRDLEATPEWAKPALTRAFEVFSSPIVS